MIYDKESAFTQPKATLKGGLESVYHPNVGGLHVARHAARADGGVGSARAVLDQPGKGNLTCPDQTLPGAGTGAGAPKHLRRGLQNPRKRRFPNRLN